jgi:adenylate cyclase
MAGPPAEAPDAADRQRLIDRLREMGAGDVELAEAETTGALNALALDLSLRGPGAVVPFEQAAESAGLELEDAVRLWRALGFPDPLETPTTVSARRAETLRVLSQMSQSLLGQETSLQLARLIGSSMAQLAEAIVDAFRLKVEMPRRDHGEPNSEVVEDYSRIASVMVPALTDALGDVLAGHLVTVSRAGWALDEQRTAITRDLVIGFADLVGYTQAARALSPADLTEAVGRFEDRAREIVSRHDGRVVKLIGDEVMFAIEDPAAAARLALDLLAEVAGDPQLPDVRVGLAAGPVVSHRGDYYGDVVNLAARLVKAAEPGTAIATEAVAAHADAEPLALPALKGYEAPIKAWRLTLR